MTRAVPLTGAVPPWTQGLMVHVPRVSARRSATDGECAVAPHEAVIAISA
jgi:hypothetical protein